MKKENYIESHCIGQWEKGDLVCNGDYKSKDEDLMNPCSWRNKCRVFTMFLEANDRSADVYVEIVSDGGEEYARPLEGLEKFDSFLGSLVAESLRGKKKKTKGKQSKIDRRKLGPTPQAKRAAAVARKKRAKEQREKTRLLIDDFREELIFRLKGRKVAKPNEIVFPGEIYEVDRAESQRYVSYYCQRVKGRPIPVVSFRTKSNTITCDAYVSLTEEEVKDFLPRAAIRKLKPRELDIGNFKTVMEKLDREKMVLLAEVVAKMISSGTIPLPSP